MRGHLAVLAAAAAAAAFLVLATPAGAGYDPLTGDYAFIDDPESMAELIGIVEFTGRAGNDLVVPRIGSEGSPVASDGKGDGTIVQTSLPEDADPYMPGTTTGTDIGNVWVARDDGKALLIRMRLHEDPHPATEAGGTAFAIDFRHAGTEVRYQAVARHDALAGWNFTLKARGIDNTVLDGGDAVWCPMPSPLEGSGYNAATTSDGGVLTFHVPYADLDLPVPPTLGLDDCAFPTAKTPAKIGDVLGEWRGTSFQTARAHDPTGTLGETGLDVTAAPYNGDATDAGTAAYTMGPAQVPKGPWEPQIFVNGIKILVDEEEITTFEPPGGGPADLWWVEVDVDGLPTVNCLYILEARLGTETALRVYQREGCIVGESGDEQEASDRRGPLTHTPPAAPQPAPKPAPQEEEWECPPYVCLDETAAAADLEVTIVERDPQENGLVRSPSGFASAEPHRFTDPQPRELVYPQEGGIGLFGSLGLLLLVALAGPALFALLRRRGQE